jgi:hypothetical protein
MKFGAEALHVLDVLCAWAQEQRSPDGYVRGGFNSLAHEAFIDSDRAREIIGFAAGIGALDDLDLDPDGRRFTARVSGWEADLQRGTEAIRKAGQRAHAAANADLSASLSHSDGTSPVEKGLVPLTKEDITKEDKGKTATSICSDLFAYWQEKTGHSAAKLTRDRRAKIEARLNEGYDPGQIRKAIDGAARAAFVNENGKRFDDIELICRTGSKLESFIERSQVGSTVVPLRPSGKSGPSDMWRAINGDAG